MADISAELAAIESAVYGEEVRDAIHDGLEKMNDDLNDAIGRQVLTVDDTLTVSGAAADSAIVGGALATVTSEAGLNWVSRGYYDNNGGYHSASSGSFITSQAMPCWGGMSIIVSGYTDNANLSAVTFFDSLNAVVGTVSNIGAKSTEYTVTVPTNAVCYRVSTHLNLKGSTYVKHSGVHDSAIYKLRAEQSTFGSEIDTVSNSVEDVKTSIGDLVGGEFSDSVNYSSGDIVYRNQRLYTYFKNHPAGAWVSTDSVRTPIVDLLKKAYSMGSIGGFQLYNGYINRTGVYNADANGNRKCTGLIPIIPGATIKYLAENNHQVVAGISFYDKNGTFITDDPTIGTIGSISTVTAPNSAYYAKLSTTKSLGHRAELYYNNGATSIQYMMDKLLDIESRAIGTETCYVDCTNGSDSADGSSTTPFKTLTKALNTGHRTIMATPGTYNEMIYVKDGSLSIKPWNKGLSYSLSVPFRPKIEILYGTKLSPVATGTTGIYSAPYTAGSDTNIYNVFVSKSISPTTQGSYSTIYNAMLVGDSVDTTNQKGNIRNRLYTPVLTETELSQEGTFWYTPGTIKFHAWDNTLESSYYIPHEDSLSGVILQNLNELVLEDVRAIGFYDNCIYINNCNSATLQGCEFGICGKGMGLAVHNSNISINDCHAFGCAVDGFNYHDYGYSSMNDCTAYYCGDDGVSHHQGCTGLIDGGEYAYNESGGITPSFGAQIEVKNTYCHHNAMGVQELGRSGHRRSVRISNSLLIDNVQSDVYATYYDVTMWNCAYRVKTTGTSGYITAYNSPIVN